MKKSKIERLRKSREGRCFAVSVAASRCRTGTRTYDRFCTNRCGPSHRRARDAPAARKNFVRQPKRTFSTVSTHSRRRARLRPPRQFSPGSSQSIESESLSWRRRHPIAPRPILIGAYLRACSFLLACLQLVGQRPQGLRHVVEALLPFRARHECENGLVAR